MKQTIAPELQTPSPQSKHTLSMVDKPAAAFISLALDMSWRLAIAVLVPIIGGFELDRHLHTLPLLTILGFVFAMAGMALVLQQTLKAAGQVPPPKVQKQP